MTLEDAIRVIVPHADEAMRFNIARRLIEADNREPMPSAIEQAAREVGAV